MSGGYGSPALGPLHAKYTYTRVPSLHATVRYKFVTLPAAQPSPMPSLTALRPTSDPVTCSVQCSSDSARQLSNQNACVMGSVLSTSMILHSRKGNFVRGTKLILGNWIKKKVMVLNMNKNACFYLFLCGCSHFGS